MDKFLETYNLSKMNHEEKENLNKPHTSKEIETVIKNFPTRKSSGPEDFTGKFYKTLKKIKYVFSQTLPKNWRGGESSKHNLWSKHYLDLKTRQGCLKKRNLMNICRNPQQNISKPNPTIHKGIIHYYKVGFIPEMQRWFNICKSIKLKQHINKMKDKIIWSSQ